MATEFHHTLMGKRFIEGTMPSLVKAVEKLNKNLDPEPIVEYETKMVLLSVHKGYRSELEHIEGMKFDSIEDLHKINKHISVWDLSEFTESANNTDDDVDEIKLMHNWIGYINLRKSKGEK